MKKLKLRQEVKIAGFYLLIIVLTLLIVNRFEQLNRQQKSATEAAQSIVKIKF